MAVNVKKRTAHNIFFGIDETTGQTRHISEVRSGVQCGCLCAFCMKPLEARKGMKRRHHFAHVTNYDCMYGNEVAVYKRVAEILDRDRVLCVPQVSLQFKNWMAPVPLKHQQALTLGDVQYCCVHEQYPPELLVTASGRKLRILLDFSDRYYSQENLDAFRTEAREKGYSIVMFKMPRFSEGNEDFYTREHLTRCLTTHGTPVLWVYSALEEKWRNRYLEKVFQPRLIRDWIECPLHKSSPGVEEPFFVGRWICGRCEFCLEDGKCIGSSGIRDISDFDLPEEELQVRVRAMQKENEEKTTEENRRREESLQNMTERQRQIKAAMDARASSAPGPLPPILLRSKAQLMHDEAVRIRESIDPASPEKTVDSFGRRWAKCDICGRVLQEEQIAEFGGPSRGLCKSCWRDGL